MHLFVYAGERTPAAVLADAVTPDGGKYRGPMVDGKFHGHGIIDWANGERYEGGFEDGLFSGKGKLTTETYAYEGEFKRGRMAGQGRYTVPSGETYVGQFADNLFNGHGKYQDGGGTYEGNFVKGVFQGTGKYTTSDYEYKGGFKQGKYAGQGQTTYKNGRRYTGTYADGLFHGKGRFETRDKLIYEGNFDKGEFVGQGTFQGADGSHYKGEFKNWKFHGKGKFRDAEGGEYQGEFKYGSFDGQGTYTYAKAQADGRTKDVGTWRYGALEDKLAEEKARNDVETALYNQRAMLDKAIAAIAPQDPDKIDLYLLAIGGDGSQEVFRREVEFVRKQFDRDFGTQGRSLALFNSRHTVAGLPMATVTSIRESIAAIARRMDKENDILFLYLTSHGSKDHKFTLNQNGIELPDLGAKELGKLLKESGIRWKVAVISACYSGGFIDPIKDKYTMVMTAARHDRTSFGCADENDFTYFGKAFFHDALPTAASFGDAFVTARKLIEKREAEDFKGGDGDKPASSHSEPQIHHSALLEQHLKQWKAQLPSPQQSAGKQPLASLAGK
ncbi:C13 family peptidase [Janthinobacterium sp. 17J80-10]|uniref:C13 family peptidase n=1 Tax=Janthinobacterium sp. 17J80-10 TaxID=2497863 RepID=UPI0013E8EDF2|nr:C13 family peptidase [Janthinobacterium sp. 17J80-10]